MSNSSDTIDQSYDRDDQITNVYPYNVRIIIVALISLLLVIIFVLLLHAYATWFLNQSRARRPPVRQVRTILQLQSLPPFGDDDHVIRFPSPMDGLDALVLDSFPTFMYKSGDYKSRLECVVCLSLFEDGERARVMPKCQHAFHVGCIDKWLQSRSSCPICRAPVVLDEKTLLAASEVIEVSGRNSDVNGVAHRVDDRVSTMGSLVEISSDSRSDGEIVKNDSPSLSSSSCSLMLSKNSSEPKVFQMALVSSDN